MVLVFRIGPDSRLRSRDRKEALMFSVIRNYPTAPTLADDLKKRSKDIEAEIGSVPGFIAYYLVKTGEGATSITVCEDQKGCDESTKRAANWLGKNMPNMNVADPKVFTGEVAFKFLVQKTVKV